MSEYGTVPYGRNLAHNPKPASLTHLSVTAGTLSLSTEDSFSGNYSAYINLPISSELAWTAAANDDADLTAIPDSSTIHASVRIKKIASSGQPAVSLRLTYTDASTDSLTISLLDAAPTNAFTRYSGSLLADAGKTIRNVTIRIVCGGSATFEGLIGGLDIRVGEPADSFIHGDAGEGYSWEGTANNSPSVREAFAITPIFGAGGQYTPTLTVEVVSRYGGALRDITEHVMDGSITYDLDADEHKGTCTLTLDEPGLVEVLGDEWVKVSLRVDRPDGTTEEGPLGVFILDPPKERWSEGADEWVYPGRDITSLLTTTFIRGEIEFLVLPEGETETTVLGAYFARAGTAYRTILEDVLINDAGLSRSQFSFSADLPQFLDADMGWDEEASVMEIITDTLEGAGWQKPWANTAGIVTSSAAGVNPAVVSPSLYISTGNNSRLRWPFEVDADVGGIGNRVRVISAQDIRSVTGRTKKRKGKKGGGKPIYGTKRHAIEVWRMNNDPSHPLSFPRLGRWIDIPDIRQPLVQNPTEAEAIADQALIEAGQLPIRVRMTTEAMVRGLNEVYELNLLDHWGEPIESGQGRYWCRGWSIQLGPPWEMVHNLSRTIDFRAASFVTE